MTIRHLKTFIAVCDYGGITKAAAALHVAQPAVSQTIAEIEKYYDVILFKRINQRLILTDYGKELLLKAKETIASFDEFETFALEYKDYAKLEIGSSLTIGKLYIPEIVNKLKKQIPQIQLSIIIDQTFQIEERLVNGNLDFAIVEGNIKSKSLISQGIAHDRLIAVASINYKIAEKVSLKELISHPLILRENGSASRESLNGVLTSHCLNVVPMIESSSNQAIISCAASGIGIAVLPQKLVDSYIAKNILKAIKIIDCDFEREYKIVYHKNKRLNDLQQQALSICKNVIMNI